MRANTAEGKAALRKSMLAEMRQSTWLHRDVALGRISFLTFLLAGDPQINVNAVDLHGETPLEVALRFDQAEIAILLLRHGATIPSKATLERANQNCETFHCINAAFNFASFLAKAIDANFSRSQIENSLEKMGDYQEVVLNNIFEGLTPLHRAVQRENPALIDLCISRRVNLEGWDAEGKPPFHRAVEDGNLTIASYLLKKSNGDVKVSSKNIRGQSVLRYLHSQRSLPVVEKILTGYLPVLKTLSNPALEEQIFLAFDQKIAQGYDLPGYTEFCNFVESLRGEFKQEEFDALFPRFVRAVEIGEKGQTHLHDAAQQNSTQLCEMLLIAGPSRPDDAGRYPIDLARNPEVRECFIREQVRHIQKLTPENRRVDIISGLPVALLIRIASHLLLKDLVEFSLVNKTTVNLLLRDPTSSLYRFFDKFIPSLLVFACQKNNAPLFELCLQRGKGEFLRGVDPQTIVCFLEIPNTTPLQQTCLTGNVGFAQRLIAAGANIHEITIDYLHHAISNRHFDVAHLLVEKGAGISSQLSLSLCAEASTFYELLRKELHLAVSLAVAIEHKDVPGVILYLQEGASANRVYENLSPLERAVTCDATEIVQLLIQNGARLNKEGSMFFLERPLLDKNYALLAILLTCDQGLNLKKNIFIRACEVDDHELAALCWDSSAENEFLCLAAEKGAARILKYLLTHGARINQNNNALVIGNASTVEVVEILLAHGVDIFVRIQDGGTLLFNARNIPVAEFLLKKGLRIEASDSKNGTALHAAITQRKSEEFIQYLMDQGANLTAKSRLKEESELSPLELANQLGRRVSLCQAIEVAVSQAEILARLIDSGNVPMIYDYLAENPKRVNNIFGKMSPLHRAIEQENSKIAAILLNGGANIHGWDEDGNTPLHRAVQTQSVEFVQWLLNNGARMDERNAQGKTAFRVRSYGLLPEIKNIFVRKYCELLDKVQDRLLCDELKKRFVQALEKEWIDLPDQACLSRFVGALNASELSAHRSSKFRAVNIVLSDPFFDSLAPIFRRDIALKRSLSLSLFEVSKPRVADNNCRSLNFNQAF